MESLDLAEQFIIQDLEEYVPRLEPRSRRKGPAGEKDPFQQQDFFRYLVSVASHPIGLRSSSKPFNSNEEEMLNYLVDMFNINEFSRLKNILCSYRDSDAEKNKVDPRKLQEIIRSRRRHSWRPELRIRIEPLTFYYKERQYIDNLTIRIYVFKEDDATKQEQEQGDNSSQDSKNQHTILNSIFKTKLETSNRIRPIKEMRCLVKFSRVDPSDESEQPKYKMVQVINNRPVDGDIRLKIRRRYCEPGSKHILRFEFWINSGAVGANWVDQYRRILKRVVYNGPSSCTNKEKSIYQNEDQEFYGYVNYNLDQLPSHAIKLSRSILTIQKRRINNCEICLEARNRRLESSHRVIEPTTGPSSTRKQVPNQDFIINHIRLYANSFLYQSLKLIQTKGDSLIGSYAMENVTIDNLLYMPAQTLANQHRLQSNLNKSEDQSLRRIALLILMNALQSRFRDHARDPIIMTNLLACLTNNEYVTARKVIDDKTLQEMNPFLEGSPTDTSDSIIEMEITMLRRFAVRTLKYRAKKFFLPIDPKDHLDRLVTLAQLIMFRKALAHHEKLGPIHQKVKNLRFDVTELRGLISCVLYVMVERHLRLRFEALLKRDRATTALQINYRGSIGAAEADSWDNLLRDIAGISNDLCLYWSTQVIQNIEEKLVGKIENTGKVDRQNIGRLIKLKIDDFLD